MDATGPPPTETVRYRPTARQVPWWNFLYPAALWFRAALIPGPGSRWLALGVTAGAALVTVWLMRVTGVTVRPDALVMHGLVTRVIPWREVDWIGPATLMGGRQVGVRYRGGRMRRLRAPQHTPVLAPDPDFDAKARTIYAAWQRATSAGSSP